MEGIVFLLVSLPWLGGTWAWYRRGSGRTAGVVGVGVPIFLAVTWQSLGCLAASDDCYRTVAENAGLIIGGGGLAVLLAVGAWGAAGWPAPLLWGRRRRR